MSKSVWGPVTWRFLHTLAVKIRPEYFNVQKENLILLIKNVCETLPCPECKAHAVSNIRRANLGNITSKEKLINFLYEFHNLVNSQTKKMIAPRLILEQYKTQNTAEAVNRFAEVYSATTYNNRLMTDTFHRKRFLEWLKQYLINNGKCFTS